MDMSNLKVLTALKESMGWTSQRQKVLATNIANADVPGYMAQDLKPLNFRDHLDQSTSFVSMRRTDARHLDPVGRQGPYRENKVRKPYETAPAGNNVIAEEQALLLKKNTIDHQISTDVYNRQLKSLLTAVGRSGN